MSILLRFRFVLPLILLPLLLTLIWFHNGLIIGNGEEGLIFYNPSKNLEISRSTWVDINTGMPNLYWLPRLPFLYLASFLTSKLGLAQHIVQAGLFFLLMLTGVASMYYLTLSLLESYPAKNLIAFLSSLFYLMNPFSMSQVWGRGLYPQYFSFALLPLSLLILVKALKQKNYLYIIPLIFSSIVYSWAFGFVTSPITYWLILGGYFIWWQLFNKFNRKEFFFGMSFMILFFSGWFLVSAWWFLPLITEGNKIFAGYLSNVNENLGTLLGVSGNFKPHLIIRLLQRTYFFDTSAYSDMYKSLFFQLISFIPVIFLAVGFIKVFKLKELKNFRFFCVLFFLGLAVSLGANPPFGQLFVWIFNNITVLQAFRNPFEKFGLVYTIGYAPLFALGLVVLINKRKMAIFWITLILFLLFGVYAWPMWTGRILAGIDKNIGVKVPQYYEDLNSWLGNNDSQNYRLFMTPLMSGEGSVFEWEGTKYNGVDPMHFILDRATVSNGAQIPFYYDFAQGIRKYMERMDVVPSFSLLRAKYLIARKDPIMISDSEKKHDQNLTKSIYTPSGTDKITKNFCEDKIAKSVEKNPAAIGCEIEQEDSDWSKYKYLHLSVQTDVPATLLIAVTDIKGSRPVWDGRAASEYKTKSGNQWTDILIPLGAPTGYSHTIDFSGIKLIEVLANPLGSPEDTVKQISIKGIWPDPGQLQAINEYRQVSSLGKLDIYEPLNFDPAPEYGIIEFINRVWDFEEFFQLAKNMRGSFQNKALLISSQNENRQTDVISNNLNGKAIEQDKISDNKYWIKTSTPNQNILLSKSFNPEWKLLFGVEKKELDGGLLNNLGLLNKQFISEDNHFVVNGYANLWAVKNNANQYAIVFMPQIYADIGSKISIFSSTAIFLGWGIILAIKKLR